jgi:probable F420-dependent oxidoreductase
VGRRVTGQGAGLRRAAPDADHHPAGRHRHRERLVGARQGRRRVVSSHRGGPGRFLLGIGIGHPEHTAEYRKPYGVLVDYLDELDAAGVPAHRRILAALGPRMLELAARRSAGTHPAFSTPEHTALTRKALGSESLVAPSQLVLINPDADASRAVGRQIAVAYLGRTNYVGNWRRLGFTDDDLTPPGSDRLIDALLAHGTAEAVAKRVNEHLSAGADHVTVLPVGPATLLPTLADLAGPLGLSAEQ